MPSGRSRARVRRHGGLTRRLEKHPGGFCVKSKHALLMCVFHVESCVFFVAGGSKVSFICICMPFLMCTVYCVAIWECGHQTSLGNIALGRPRNFTAVAGHLAQRPIR